MTTERGEMKLNDRQTKKLIYLNLNLFRNRPFKAIFTKYHKIVGCNSANLTLNKANYIKKRKIMSMLKFKLRGFYSNVTSAQRRRMICSYYGVESYFAFLSLLCNVLFLVAF